MRNRNILEFIGLREVLNNPNFKRVQFDTFRNRKYLNILSKYGGVIIPDYSLYRDMPLSMQIWNVFRSRALGYFMQSNGVKVLPNGRFSDERTYDIACAGVKKNSTITFSTYELMKIKKEKEIFKKGLDYVIRKLTPL